MSEHKHNWRIFLNKVACECQQTMTYAEAEQRLNDYERLEQANEKLSDANVRLHARIGTMQEDADRDSQLIREFQEENRRLRQFLNEIGYPDTAISVMLEASEMAEEAEDFGVDFVEKMQELGADYDVDFIKGMKEWGGYDDLKRGEDFEEGEFDSETDAVSDLENYIFTAPPFEGPHYMAVGFPQERPWHSVWEHRHPDCSKTDWELRVYHNTPDEQYLGLYCRNCGKTVDTAEIINALLEVL